MFTFVLLSMSYLSGLASANYACNAANAVNNQAPTPDSQLPSTGYPNSDASPAFIPSFAPAIEAIGRGSYEASLPGRLRSRRTVLESRNNAIFECGDAEACFLGYGFFACVNPVTYDFEDSLGGKGNLGRDVYTMSNGAVTTIAGTATALPTAESTASSSATVVAAASSDAAPLKTPTRFGVDLGKLIMVLSAAGALGV